ncbi:hypothetical protein B0H19DRAFT_1162500 [Mycena capillaripes]|nr:hypothetical protein B0H19DRAFT_1162500 [Mycena capillaripes]
MASGSSSASSSGSGSASPEPEIRPAKTSKSKAAEKAKAKSSAQEKGRNEGEDPHWAYVPPKKTERLEESADVGEFDWDALNGNPDLELWLVRIPDGVKPRYLESAQVELPAAARRDSKKSAKMGMLQRKLVAYDIWSVGDDAPEEMPIGGEEIKGLSCLVPRKSKKGRLYAAPTPIARTIVVAAQGAKPTPDPSNATSPNERPVYKNPPRESHPIELLTHRFVPYGAADGGGGDAGRASTPMEVEPEVLVPDTPQKSSKDKKDKGDGKKTKGKKRKGEEDGESPKKPKKAKTAS